MEFKQAIIVRQDLAMGKGKIAAQASHACLEAYEKTKQQHPEWIDAWKSGGQGKIVLKVKSKEELIDLFQRAKRTLPTALIKDAGHTQIEPGSETCIAIGPAPEAEINKFTKDLKLL